MKNPSPQPSPHSCLAGRGRTIRCAVAVGTFLFFFLFNVGLLFAEAPGAFQKLHQKAVNRTRRIIFNNDGNEPVVLCKSATVEELLRYRCTPLIGSQVDSIFYCTWSSGFSLFNHDTKVGQVFNTREGMFTNNLTQEFLDKGIDPLRVVTDFGHTNGMEVFWSFRMNDTHDAGRTGYGPVFFRANKLKNEHPEYLIGSKEKPPKLGTWSSVDYGVPEIRKLALQFCEEVCRNYDVDGIELDFFRHAFFFKCSGDGKPCGEKELDQMTSLIRDIRAMSEREGRKRNRPILIAIRVPDSVEYSKRIGLDWERWLSEKLVDLLIVSGYTQLNPWEYSVQLGHRYGAKVYPSLDEPRIRDEVANKLRFRNETYRGRAMNVWASGADGVYIFNFFEPRNPLFQEMGDPKILGQRDRNYFASVRGVGSVPVPHREFINITTLNPGSPVEVNSRQPGRISFYFGEKLSNLGKKAQVELRVQCKTFPPTGGNYFRLNGKELRNPVGVGEWLHFKLVGKLLRKGENVFEITLTAAQTSPLTVTDLYVSIVHQKL